jgi:hypothetical protein
MAAVTIAAAMPSGRDEQCRVGGDGPEIEPHAADDGEDGDQGSDRIGAATATASTTTSAVIADADTSHNA